MDVLFDFDPKGLPDAILDLRLPGSIKPGQIPHYIRSVSAQPEKDILAIVEPLDEAAGIRGWTGWAICAADRAGPLGESARC